MWSEEHGYWRAGVWSYHGAGLLGELGLMGRWGPGVWKSGEEGGAELWGSLGSWAKKEPGR